MPHKLVQLKVPHRTWERWRQFAEDEGVLNDSDEPVITRALKTLLTVCMDIHEDSETQELRQATGAKTTGIMKVAAREHVAVEIKRRRSRH